MFEEENYIFYPSNKSSNKNIGFSSSSNYTRKRAVSFTPNDSKMSVEKSKFEMTGYKSDNEKENYLDFTNSESDYSFTLIEENNKENEIEHIDFHRNDRISKTQTLALFNKNYDILYNKIIDAKNINNQIEIEKKFTRRPNRSISVNVEELIQ